MRRAWLPTRYVGDVGTPGNLNSQLGHSWWRLAISLIARKPWASGAQSHTQGVVPSSRSGMGNELRGVAGVYSKRAHGKLTRWIGSGVHLTTRVG